MFKKLFIAIMLMCSSSLLAEDFSNKEKDGFVNAYSKVATMQQELQGSVDESMDDKEVQKEMDKFNQKVRKTIEKEDGITVEGYTAMLTKLQSDNELAKDI